MDLALNFFRLRSTVEGRNHTRSDASCGGGPLSSSMASARTCASQGVSGSRASSEGGRLRLQGCGDSNLVESPSPVVSRHWADGCNAECQEGTGVGDSGLEGHRPQYKSQLKSSWHTAFLQNGRILRAQRRQSEPRVEDLISTAENTPEKGVDGNAVLRHMLQMQRRAKRHEPTKNSAVEFFKSDLRDRKAFSETDYDSPTKMSAWQAEMALRRMNANIVETNLYDSQLEALDAKRVRRGEVGLMKMVTMLGRGQLSQHDQDGYWSSVASGSHHTVQSFFAHLLETSRHNMTEHQRLALATSLDRRKRMFDIRSRADVCHVVTLLRGKPSRVKPVTMVAQFRITDLMPTLRVEHRAPEAKMVCDTLERALQRGVKVHVPFAESLMTGVVNGKAQAFVIRTTTMIATFSVMDTWTQRALVLVQYLMSFDSVCAIIYQAVGSSAQVFESFLSPGEMVAQADQRRIHQSMAELEAHRESIVGALCAVIGSAFRLEAPSRVFENMARTRRIVNIAQVCSSVTSISSFMHTCVGWVLEYAQAKQLGMDIPTYRLYTISPKMPEFICKVHALYGNNGVHRAGRERYVAETVKELYKLGYEYLNILSKSRATPAQIHTFSMTWERVREMHKAATQYFSSHKSRKEPLVVYLLGHPGVGKSQLVHYLMPDVCERFGVPFNELHDVYARSPASKHWDGYSRQKFVIFDDFLQSEDKNIRSVEAFELVQAKNNMAWSLNMARVEDKGVTNFESPFVFITSNTDIPSKLGVTSELAVRRRRDLLIQVAVMPQFADSNGMVNRKAVMQHYRCPDSKHIYSFVRLDPITGEQLGPLVSYDHLLSVIEEEARLLWGDVRQTLACSSADDEEVVLLSSELYEEIEHSAPAEEESASSASSSESGDSEPSSEMSSEDEKEFGENLAQHFFQERNSPVPCVENVMSASREEMRFTRTAWDSWTDYKNALCRALTTFGRRGYQFKENHEESIKMAIMGLTTLAGVLAVWKLSQYWRKPNEVAEASASGDQKTRYVRRDVEVRKGASDFTHLPPRGFHHPPGVASAPAAWTSDNSQQIAQAASDPRGLQLLRMRFSTMVCLVYIFREDNVEIKVHGLLIGGKLIAVPNHVYEIVTHSCGCLVRAYNGDYMGSFDDIVIYDQWREHDLAIMVMPNDFPSYPKQVQHFVNEKDFKHHYLEYVYMMTAHTHHDTLLPVVTQVGNPKLGGPHEYRLEENSPKRVQIVEALHYKAQTENGDCGAPLIWLHPAVNRKIIGFHVAGGMNVGASNILTFELMDRIFTYLGTTVPPTPDASLQLPTLSDGIADLAQMHVEGLADQSHSFRQPCRSEIIPSLIHGVFPPWTAPAALRIRGEESPLEIGIRKGVRKLSFFPREDLDFVQTQILNHYQGAPECMERRVLTMSEGLNGVSGNQWIRPLNMSTSPGAPYIFEHRLAGKRSFVQFVDGKWEYTPRLYEAVQHRISEAAQGRITETLFVDVLKDERRELAKVESLNTRIFNTCPMDLNIAIRMYFSAFAAHIMHNNIDCEIAVGINYHSGDWGMLYRRLKTMGSHWIAGDYSKYDKTLPRQLMLMVAWLANKFYNDGNEVIRNTLMETLASRFHLANRVIYYQAHGNPSGNPLTVIINSLANMALMRLAYLELARDNDIAQELNFSDNVALSVYGDDNVGVVSDRALWFNMENISRVLGKYGVIYTPPKIYEQDVIDFIPCSEVTYLKRSFREEGSNVFAPLPRQVIQEIVNWIRKSNDPRLATVENVFMAQLEMFHWGRTAYEEFTQTVNHACWGAKLEPKITPFGYFLDRWYNKAIGATGKLVWVPCDQGKTAPGSSCAMEALEALGYPRPGFYPNEQMVNKTKTQELEMSAQAGRGRATATKKKPQNSQKKNQKSARKPQQTTVVVKPTVLSPTNNVNVNTKKATRFAGKELLRRLDGSVAVVAIPLVPGMTGAPKLDQMARFYSWVEWVGSPTITYRSLNPLSTATWSIGVFHDLTPDEVVSANSHLWDVHSPAYVVNSASANYRVTVNLSSMMTKKFQATGGKRCSWVFLVRTRSADDNGELYLQWQVQAGGSAVQLPPPIVFEVKNGRFYDPKDKSKPLEGFPFMGPLTTYTFGSSPPPTARMIQDFVSQTKGLPVEIVRPPPARISEVPLTKESPVQRVTLNLGEGVIGAAAQALGSAVTTGAEKFGMKALRSLGYGVAAVGKWLGLVKSGNESPFAGYSGTVEVSQTLLGSSPYAGIETTPPLVYYPKEEADKSETKEIVKISGRSIEVHASVKAMVDSWQQERFAPVAAIGLAELMKIVGTIGTAVELGKATASIIPVIMSKLRRHPMVVHRGMDALHFVEGRLSQGIVSPPPTGDGTWDGEGEYDPDAVNPLPDVPEFGAGGDAPGEEVPWAAARRYIAGFVTDDNGTPIVKWLGGWNREDMAQFFTAPQPMWYSKIRRPWDKENKRVLACKLEIDEALQDHYLLLQCYNWGDDSCGGWSPNTGGQYYGTVARFGGVTESRSVAKVTDWTKWNDSNDFHLWIGQSTQKYFSSDEGRACLFGLYIGAVKSEEIALNFLASWTTHSSVTRLRNHRYKKKGGEQPEEPFQTYTDFSYTLNAALSELDPLAPAFAENYHAFKQDPSHAWNVDRLPVKIEAGPLRVIMLARYDDQNGWWQDVPYFAYTRSSLSSEWSVSLCLAESSDATIAMTRPNSTQMFSNVFCTVKPPSNLATSSVWLAYEIVTMNGENGASAGRVHDSSWNDTWVTTAGPVGVTRGALPANSGPFRVRIYGDTSRPSTAVDGFGGDIYVAAIATFYLLRNDAGKQAIEQWLFHDTPPSMRKFPTLTHDYTSDGFLSSTSPRTYMNNYMLEKKSNGVWRFGSTMQFSGAIGHPCYTTATAPLRASCPLYKKTGYTVVAKSLGLEDVAREVSALTYVEEADEPENVTYPTDGPKPPESLPSIPEEPQPAPATEWKDLVTIQEQEELDLGPAIPGKVDVFDDKYAVTHWSMALAQRQIQSGTETTDRVRNVSAFINYHDMRGVIPVQSDVSGNPSSSSSGVETIGPNFCTLMFGVPMQPKAGAPLTLIQIKDVGRVSWDYEKSPAELTVESAWNGLELFVPPASSVSINTTSHAFSYGHTHQFRKLRCQMFTSRVLDQSTTVSDSSYRRFGVVNRNNKLMVAFEIDMADPRGKYSDVVNAYMSVQYGSSKTGYYIDAATLERGIIVASFEPYEAVVKQVLKILPEMVEFVGKLKCAYGGYSTYIPEVDGEPEVLRLDELVLIVGENTVLGERDDDVSTTASQVAPDQSIEPPPELAGEDVEKCGANDEPPPQ